jgi:hypothetical protein
MAGTGKQGWAEFFSFSRRSKNLRARRVRLLSVIAVRLPRPFLQNR